MAQETGMTDLVVALLVRRQWLTLTVFSTIAVVTASFTASLPNVYSSSATILIENQQIPDRYVEGSFTGDLSPYLHRMKKRILARSSLLRLMDDFGLYADVRGREGDNEATELFRRSLDISMSSGGGALPGGFEITFTAEDPRTAADVANEIASMYVDEDLATRERQAKGTTEFLDRQLAEMKRKLDEQESQLKEFQEREGPRLRALDGSNGASVDRLRVQLVENREKKSQVTAKREAVERRLVVLGETGPPPIGDPQVEIARVEQEYEELRQLRDELAAVEHDTKRLDTEAQEIRQAMALQEQELRELPELERQLKLLQRDYNTTQELYRSMLKSYENARVAESLEHHQKGEQLRVLDPAIVPNEPTGPKRLRFLLLGLGLALGASAAVVFLVEQLDTSFHSLEELRSFSTVPVLVTIPKMKTKEQSTRARRLLWIRTGSLVVGLPVLGVIAHVIARDNQTLVRLLP